MVFGRQDARVKKDKDDDEPVERLGLDESSTHLAGTPVPLRQRPSDAEQQINRVRAR